MNTISETTGSPMSITTRALRKHRRAGTQAPGGLPPGFDAEAFTRQACERSGVTFAVTDPVALAKLRVLTRPST